MSVCSVARPGYTVDAVCSGDLVLVLVDAEGDELPAAEELKAIVDQHVGPCSLPLLLADLGMEPSLGAATVLYASRLFSRYRVQVLRAECPVFVIDSKGERLGSLTMHGNEENWMSPPLREYVRTCPEALGEILETVREAWSRMAEEGMRELSKRAHQLASAEENVPVQRDWQKTLRVERP